MVLVYKLRPFVSIISKGITTTSCKQAIYVNTPFVANLANVERKFEVTQDPEDWKFVERALPPKIVPDPRPKSEYTSEWRPQGDDVKDLSYYIARTKNHMMPVYLETYQRGMRRITRVRKIQGDIWQLEKELRKFLQPQQTRPIRSQVNEFAGYIRFHGDHVNAIKWWLMQKNL